MVSAKLWTVIFCIAIECVAMIHCDPPEKLYCVCELLNTLAEVSKGPIPKSSQGLYTKYNNLKCGFVYSAHFHMYWTRDTCKESRSKLRVLFTNVPRLPCNEISFVDESVMIIDLLFYKQDIQLNELWLLYAYAQQMDSYCKGHAEKAKYDVAKNLEMHDFVFGQLENYLKSNCQENYYFQTDCEHCEYYHRNTIIPGKNKTKYNYTDRQNAVRVNKTALNALLQTNIKKRDLALENGVPFYNISQLYFNSLYTSSVLVGFLEENLQWAKWNDVSCKIENAMNMATRFWDNPGLQNIIYTGKYQQMVMDLLKIIALNKIGRCLVNIRHCLLFKVKFEFSSSVEKLVGILTDFMNAVSLDEDRFLVGIRNNLNSTSSTNNPKELDVIFNLIESEINAISNIWQYPVENSLSNYDNYRQTSDLENNMNSANDFVSKLKNTFGVYTFRYIHSYAKMVDDVTNKINTLWIGSSNTF